MTSTTMIDLVRQFGEALDAPAERAWVNRAACRHVDPELFFPIGTAGPALDQVRAAKAMCARCPVAVQCLDDALRTGQDHGVWGGTTPEERRSIRQRAGARAGRYDESA